MTSGSAAARVRWFVASIADKGSPEAPAQIARAESQSKPRDAVEFQTRTGPDPSSDNLVAVASSSTELARPSYPTTNAPPFALLDQPPKIEPTSDRLASESPRSLPLVSMAPRAASAASVADPQAAQQIGWEDLVGHTGGQQLKTALAALGVLVLLYQLSRRIA